MNKLHVTHWITLGLVVGMGLRLSAGEDFTWDVSSSDELRSVVPQGIPASGAYSVRFRAALTHANGGRLFIEADGVRFQCCGDGFTLEKSTENHVIPGELDDRNFNFTLRNRCFHDFCFVCLPDRIILFGDGDEKRPVLKAPGSPHGFRLGVEKASLVVTGLEASAGDRRTDWICRNMLINGGFEQLNNGYAPYWTTHNFGFTTAEQLADLKKTRAGFHVDGSVAYEGTHSMFLNSWMDCWECWRTRPQGDYVFSVYARAQRDGARMVLRVSTGYTPITNRVVTLTTEWRRYDVAFHSSYGSFRCGVHNDSFHQSNGIWFDAAQLEHGRTVTDYVTRPLPKGGVPPNQPQVMDHYYEGLNSVREPSGKPPRLACVDPKRNSFRFDGKEYFMYGFTGFCPDGRKTTLAALDVLQSWGINMHLNHDRLTDAAKLREGLDACAKRGIRLSVSVRYDRKAGKIDEKELDVLAAVADHPAWLSIDLFDECYGCVTPEKRLEVADYVRRRTGGRIPISFNEFDLGVLNHMDYSAADIASADLYVPGVQEISAQYYILKQLRDDNPDRVITYYPFVSGHFSVWPRDATYDEVMAQAYIGYVLEVYNIKWWQAVPQSEDAIRGVIDAKRERDFIDPSAFLDGERAHVTCDARNDAVKFTARTLKNGVTRIVAVNIENRANDATWKLPANVRSVRAVIGRLPDARPTPTCFADRFGPLERRVYDVTLDEQGHR